MPPTNDRRLVVLLIGLAMLGALAATAVLAYQSKAIPTEVIALVGTALGLLAPSPLSKSAVPDPAPVPVELRQPLSSRSYFGEVATTDPTPVSGILTTEEDAKELKRRWMETAAEPSRLFVAHLAEAEGRSRRLGRHVEHDDRSWNFPASTAPVHSMLHVHHGQPLDQGQVGSCTGNATVQNLMTEPLFHGQVLSEADALHVYELATRLDGISGSYPPNDTGSSGLAAAKAAKRLGLLTGYRHAFGVEHAIGALMLGPVMFGTVWLDGMDSPDPTTGLVHAMGPVRGGHEYTGIGYDAQAQEIICLNSWGPTYGVDGVFRISKADMASLLADGGDVVVLRDS